MESTQNMSELFRPVLRTNQSYCTNLCHLLNRKSRVLRCSADDSVLKSSRNGHAGQMESKISRRNVVLVTPTLLSTASFVSQVSGELALPQSSVAETEFEKPLKTSTGPPEIEKRVHSFVLKNGMRWIVAERHIAPILACHTRADVGAADEKNGLTGIAHLLEHLAFKGTKQIGTNNWKEESKVLDQLDEVFYELRDAIDAKNLPKQKRLSDKLNQLKSEASQFVVPNKYGALLSRAGAIGLNAQTSQDSTEYFVSLPANKLELWMALESARFREPVFRELYSEKEVVFEERRLRVDNSPLGPFFESFGQLALPNSPYGRPVIGTPGDLARMGRREVESFFREKYSPQNLICSVVGDVDPAEVERLATQYFGSWKAPAAAQPPAAPLPAWRQAASWQEDSGWLAGGPRELRMSLPGGPYFISGFHRPAESSVDSPVIAVLTQILSGSRSSRFYKSLVASKKLLSASAIDFYPDRKRSSLALVYGSPENGKSPEWVQECLLSELRRVKEFGVTSAELAPIQKLTAVGMMDLFSSNENLASALCKYECLAGDWRALLAESLQLQSVTAQDVQRVAQQLFREDNMVLGYVTKSNM